MQSTSGTTTPGTSSQVIENSPQVIENNRRTPREEFSWLFRQGSTVNRHDIPPFQRRTTWGPQSRFRNSSPYSNKEGQTKW